MIEDYSSQVSTIFSRSCDHCRNLKVRCCKTIPSCKRCTKKDIPCTRNNPIQKRGPKPKFIDPISATNIDSHTNRRRSSSYSGLSYSQLYNSCSPTQQLNSFFNTTSEPQLVRHNSLESLESLSPRTDPTLYFDFSSSDKADLLDFTCNWITVTNFYRKSQLFDAVPLISPKLLGFRLTLPATTTLNELRLNMIMVARVYHFLPSETFLKGWEMYLVNLNLESHGNVIDFANQNQSVEVIDKIIQSTSDIYKDLYSFFNKIYNFATCSP